MAPSCCCCHFPGQWNPSRSTSWTQECVVRLGAAPQSPALSLSLSSPSREEVPGLPTLLLGLVHPVTAQGTIWRRAGERARRASKTLDRDSQKEPSQAEPSRVDHGRSIGVLFSLLLPPLYSWLLVVWVTRSCMFTAVSAAGTVARGTRVGEEGRESDGGCCVSSRLRDNEKTFCERGQNWLLPSHRIDARTKGLTAPF